MTEQQLNALMEYIRDVAALAAELAVNGSGFTLAVRRSEERLRQLFLVESKGETK
jgi:hypothetical protein